MIIVKTNIININFLNLAGLLFCLFAMTTYSATGFAQDSGGVLVCSDDSMISKSSLINIRRIYLGLPASSDSKIKNPILNTTDIATYNIFLKNVMHMTEKGYRRKLVKQIFRQGRKNIPEIDNTRDLVSYLKQHRNDVSFMSADTAKNTQGIKVVQVLW